jgi:hypothetical protein
MNSQVQIVEFKIRDIQDKLYEQELKLKKYKNTLTKDEIEIIYENIADLEATLEDLEDDLEYYKNI